MYPVKTKIICTLGPATDDEHVITKLLTEGLNVARLNFSHGTHEDHLMRLNAFRDACAKTGVCAAVLLDTKGPEIRTGKFKDGSVELKTGQEYCFTSREVLGDESICSISYANLCNDIGIGQQLMVDDGLVELRVQNIADGDLHCVVINGGAIGTHKSINVPNAQIKLPALTDKDLDDLRFAVDHEFDFIAMSFVREADDVLKARKALEKLGGSGINIIAKIENRQGVLNSEDIIRVSDGIMVARGDLGVEIPLEEIPIVQKQLIKQCITSGKPVITATQMLDSMIRNPRPTRAEVCDVANAVYDGTSCLMLSGETAVGKYPVEALHMMVQTARQTEESIHYWRRFENWRTGFAPTIANAISHSTCMAAFNLTAKAILTVTKSGKTARLISRFRPESPIIAATPSLRTRRQLCMSWGVMPFIVDEVRSTDDLFDVAVETALKSGLVLPGEIVVITAGVPVGYSGTTNIVKVQMAGNVIASGTGVCGEEASGELCVAHTFSEVKELFNDGDILVVKQTSNEYMPYMRRAVALVVEEDDPHGHAATVGMALDIPVIIGVAGATGTLPNGSIATVDAVKGLVFQKL